MFYTNAGDCPECILCSTIELTPDWQHWQASAPVVVLEPELEYEGGHLPRRPSARGLARDPVCQLRDPAIFREHGHTYLLYSVAGERGIAIAELKAEQDLLRYGSTCESKGDPVTLCCTFRGTAVELAAYGSTVDARPRA